MPYRHPWAGWLALPLGLTALTVSGASIGETGDLRPPLFRLGSGAKGPVDPLDHTEDWTTLGKGTSLNPVQSDTTSFLSTARQPRGLNKIKLIIYSSAAMMLMSIYMYMMPGGNNNDRSNFNYRIPPTWSPENDHHYSFRAYMTDISLWIMLTDLLPHQQCAAIIMRLGGSAREMARMIRPQEMMQGGMLNGVQVDPVTHLLGALHAKFSALEEESRLSAMTEMLAFSRKQGEGINALLARYEIVRQRAALEGQFVMSTEGCALQLLKACGIQAQHLFILLQPFGNQLPQDDAQFNLLAQQLRRYGHITENAPGNVAAALNSAPRQARPGAYWTENDTQAYWQAARTTADAGGAGTYFERSQQGLTPGSVWDSLLPQEPGSADPFAAWATGREPTQQPGVPWESGNAEPWSQSAYPAMAFPVTDYTEDDGTNTDTSSDSGHEVVAGPDTSRMSEAEAASTIYMAYRGAKRTWRRFTGKPVRKFRRTFKKHHKGKGKGGRGFFLTQDDVHAYLQHKGKGHRKGSSGKGFGRKGNPKDRNGNTMKCHECNSEDHLVSRCPNKGAGKGGGIGGNFFSGIAFGSGRVQPEPQSQPHLGMQQQRT